ncbi:MAG: radical SAM family RiPP maturation amino acid epimerase [Holophagales bacterium]|nr:radical SAM family RiPP maturation amino acid epimerase [Holophagales bacterium]
MTSPQLESPSRSEPRALTEPALPEIGVAQAKRALEWYSSSRRFRELVDRDPERAGEEFGLGFDVGHLRPLYDPFFAHRVHENGEPVHPVVKEYREFFVAKTRWRDRVKAECSPDEPRFEAWRRRQVARSEMESGAYDEFLIHTPLAIEITEGCSVGCWFCGVGSTRVGASWPYTDANAGMWRDMMAMFREKIGHAASWGFLYWATDPLDNPDYEKLAHDFADAMGIFPQTTTAQAHRHVERLRRLLPVSQERGCRVNRFSVLSEKLLRQIYAAFTPEEMLQVEVVAQMPEATTAKAEAGAFRDKAAKNPKVAERERAKLRQIADTSRELARLQGQETEALPVQMAQPGTIACVSGFLLNMVQRRVRLISPCVASERWPLGYIVFDDRTFTDARDLEAKVEDMMSTHMTLGLRSDDELHLHPDMRYGRSANGFRISTERNEMRVERPELADYVGEIGDMLFEGGRTAEQIALASFFRHGVPEANTLGTLEAIFRQGLLMDSLGRIAGRSRPGAG